MQYRAFASPVDAEEVTDYYTVIAVPIDLGTMADKVEAGAYISYEDFRWAAEHATIVSR